jgi:cell pole-organizing protein PopZ
MSDGKPQSRSEDQEPSMEEILSSIRKIIASDEEEGKPPKAAAAGAARPEREEGDEVLELTDVVPEEEGAGREQPPAASDLDALEERARAELDEVSRRVEAAETPPPRAAVPPAESLVSEAAASAATAAFARLARSVSRPEPGPVVPDSGKSVEVFVAELLRPMLKEWLDANLPAIVERVVEQEVKKLAKRAELL